MAKVPSISAGENLTHLCMERRNYPMPANISPKDFEEKFIHMYVYIYIHINIHIYIYKLFC
jgi:hypothetical protein